MEQAKDHAGDLGDSDPPEIEEPVFPQANIIAITTLANALATAYGPVSHEKLIINKLATREEPKPGQLPTDDVTVTGDGATILDELEIEHPIAPIVRRLAGPERPGDTDVVGQDIPDGVTGTFLLASKLLDEAERLLDLGVHPRVITSGYENARNTLLDALDDLRTPIDSITSHPHPRHAVAMTAMTGNISGDSSDIWARRAVEAVDLIGMPNAETFAVRQTKSGSIVDSHLVSGAVLDRNDRADERMPSRVTDATVLVLGGQHDGGLREREFGSELDEHLTASIDSVDQLDALDDYDRARRAELVDSLVELDVDVVVARQGITREYQELLVDHGIMGIRGVTRLDLVQVALATGASQLYKSDDVTEAMLGHAGLVEERTIEQYPDRRRRRRMIVFDECDAPGSVTAMLHGVSGHLADQSTTEIRKAAAAVARASGLSPDGYEGVVPGGGATWVDLATRLKQAARALTDREQLVIEAYANALESVVAVFVRNAGADPIDTVTSLRAAHDTGERSAGFILPEGDIGDALSRGILDPAEVRRRQVTAATDVARMILRIDDTIDATFEVEKAGPEDAIYDDIAEQHETS